MLEIAILFFVYIKTGPTGYNFILDSTQINLKSYIILGIYTAMVTYYFKGDSSLFVLITSLFIELILLFIGAVLVRKSFHNEDEDIGISGVFYALFACTVFIYPMAYMLGNAYSEFTEPAAHGYFQPFIDYKWQIITMAFSLGIGYLVDFNALKNNNTGKYISSEVFRICILLFSVGLVGMICIAWIKEVTQFNSEGNQLTLSVTPYTKDTKMFPIITIIAVRMVIEILYLRRVNDKSSD